MTSGGDSPGMNAAIRSVVRCGLDKQWELYGVKNGYAGLINGEYVTLGARDVGGVIQQGGTILGTARCPEFKTEDGRNLAIRMLKKKGIESLVVIGGNGSQTGALELHKMGFPVVGIASTIDNDLYGVDMSLGVDTALNIALEATDRLKITATSHKRAFLVEVMGRNSGYLALMTAIASGAEAVIIPEINTDPDKLAGRLSAAYDRGKAHALVIVAEGAKYNAEALKKHFIKHRDRLGFELRTTVLGHVQRGGSPLAFDRILGTRQGAKAVELLSERKYGFLVGLRDGKIDTVPLQNVIKTKKGIDMDLLDLSEILAM